MSVVMQDERATLANSGRRSDDQPAVRRPRLYLDCSMTAQSTSWAGIQRVVRNVAASASELADSLGLDCRLVVFRDGYWRDTPSALDQVRAVSPSPATKATRAPASTLPAWSHRLGSRLYKVLYPRTFVRTMRRWSSNALGLGAPRADFQAGDILLLLDGSWLMSEIPRFEAARRGGARIGLVVYDLLPINYPQFMLPKACRQFTRWMRRVVPQMDFHLAISRAIRDEYRAWLPQAFPERPIAPETVSWFPLGVQLDLVAIDGEVRSEVRAALDGSAPTYIKVCTLDPRKNHSTVLDAFEQVWRTRPEARLCFIGRPGWMSQKLEQRINDHPRRGRQLFWFQGITDAELNFCFRHAHGSIFASFAEGYGLPIAESLQYGLPTFVSDIPVHREVGGDFCIWFDPHRAETLAQRIVTHLTTGGSLSPRLPSEYRPTTWAEATRAMIDECRRLSGARA